MTMKKDYIRPMMKHIGLDEMLLAGESLPFGEGKVSAEEADAQKLNLFDADEAQSESSRNCWNDYAED